MSSLKTGMRYAYTTFKHTSAVQNMEILPPSQPKLFKMQSLASLKFFLTFRKVICLLHNSIKLSTSTSTTTIQVKYLQRLGYGITSSDYSWKLFYKLQYVISANRYDICINCTKQNLKNISIWVQSQHIHINTLQDVLHEQLTFLEQKHPCLKHHITQKHPLPVRTQCLSLMKRAWSSAAVSLHSACVHPCS